MMSFLKLHYLSVINNGIFLNLNMTNFYKMFYYDCNYFDLKCFYNYNYLNSFFQITSPYGGMKNVAVDLKTT